MTLSRRKTIIYFALSLALVAAAVFWVGAAQAHAASKVTAPLKDLASSVVKGVADTTVALGIVYIALLFVYELALIVLGFAGAFLDYVFRYNLVATPGNNPVVLAGWTALRDLANGLFILIVLWIAITIIFNLDSWGGRKLLVRVIVVALLINFSLLMTTTIFAFSNQLALPFARALGVDPYNKEVKGSLSSAIVANTHLHSVAKTTRETDAEQMIEGLKALAQEQSSTEAPSQKQNFGPTSQWFASIPYSFGAALVLPSAQADTAGGVAVGVGCVAAAGLLFLIPAGITQIAAAGLAGSCATMGLLAAPFVNIFSDSGGPIEFILKQYVSLAVAGFFLVVTASALFSAAILLAVRYIAIIFLGVFAPIAFMGLVIPRYGDRLWNMWLDNLFRWSFVAPIFYFLMYLALYMLEAVSAAQSKIPNLEKSAIQGNIVYILSLMIFLVFLWASIFLTRKAAGMGAEAALTFSKKLAGVGLGVGTGLAARKVLPWMGRAATGLQEKINQSPLARATFGRGLTAYGLGGVTRASRRQLQERQEYINRQGWTSAEIQQRLASGYFKSDTDVAAAVGVLKSRGDLDRQAGVEGYGAEHIERAAGVYRGLKTDLVPLMRANPTIAKEADFRSEDFDFTKTDSEVSKALREITPDITKATDDDKAEARKTAIERLAWSRVRPEDVPTALDTNLLKGDTADKKRNRRRFLETATGPHLSRLANRDPQAAREIQAELEADPALWNSFPEKKKEYFESNAAQEIGIWRVPPGAATRGTSAFRVLVRNPTATITHGAAYTSAPLVAGGSGTYTATYSSSGGRLPPGLSIDNTGRITGTVSSIVPPGNFRGQYDIDDGSGGRERITFNITIT